MKIQKKIFFYFFALLHSLSLTSSYNLFATTVETYDILDLAPVIHAAHHKDHTLILFDIDDTLLDSPISLNSGPWITYYWKNAPRLLPEKMPIIEELMWYISKSIPNIAVDSFTAPLISACQKNPLTIPLAFTARPIYKKHIDGIKVTADQLLNVNINFSLTDYPTCLAKHPSFHAGIIFTSGKMKGDFLQHFLASTGYLPSRILFIDDKLDQIQSVEKAMQEAGIKVDCFWYKRAASKRPAFDLQLANIQLEYLLKHQLIINDEVAAILMTTEKYASVPADDFLKQLIELYEKMYFNNYSRI